MLSGSEAFNRSELFEAERCIAGHSRFPRRRSHFWPSVPSCAPLGSPSGFPGFFCSLHMWNGERATRFPSEEALAGEGARNGLEIGRYLPTSLPGHRSRRGKTMGPEGALPKTASVLHFTREKGKILGQVLRCRSTKVQISGFPVQDAIT